MTELVQGTYTAIVTPFAEGGAVNLDAFGKLIDHQLEGGVGGLVVCGTTGERATLHDDEYRRVATYAIKRVTKRVRMVLGTGSNDTAQSLEANAIAQDLGYDYALSVCPYYNKPTQEGLYAHFMRQADTAKIPIILYNVPGRTCSNLSAETCLRLAKHDRLVAVKEASGNLDQIMAILAARPEGFSVMSGDDALTLAMVSLGADGVISVASNEIPAEMTRLVDLARAGRIEEARSLHYRWLPLLNINFVESNPVPVKYVLSKMGLCGSTTRLPLVPLTEASAAKVDRVLVQLGLMA